MAFKRSVLARALPFPKKLPMHDQWLGLMAENPRFIDDVVVEWRRHQRNQTLGQRPTGWVKRWRWRQRLGLALLQRRGLS